jgi:UDP-3-O-[3-hydroxymyristoyl] glucosamine N-acyltransferase
MSDSRADRGAATISLGDVSEIVGGRLVGPADTRVAGVAPLDEAGPHQLAFLGLRRYVRLARTSRAGSFLVSEELEGELHADSPRIVVGDAYDALRTLLGHLYAEPTAPPSLHPTVVLGRGTRLGEGVSIGPYAVLEDAVEVGAHTRIGAHCVLGTGTHVGARCTLHPQVVAYPGSVIGDDVILHAGVRIGSDGFGYTAVEGTPTKMPQVGRAVVGNGVEIGANSTIDRGSLGDTVVGERVKIDNLVQVAHNVKIGAGSLLAALVGIAGSTRIGRGVWFGGRASAINHLEVGDGARVTFGSTLTRDVAAGETVSGYPARPHREELRRQAELGRVSRLAERIRRLEARLDETAGGRGASR